MTTEFILIETPTATLTGERVSEHFAITPTIGRYSKDGPVILTGGTSLTHIPSGKAVTTDSWSDMRKVAVALEATGIDWASFEKLDAEQRPLIVEAIKAGWSSGDDDGWPWPEWAGDESHPADSLLAVTLDGEIGSHDRFRKVSDLGKQARDLLPEDLGKQIDALLMVGNAESSMNRYGVAYLLAVLQRIDPVAADAAARDLVSQWDAGDTMGEWVYQWRDELALGKPLTLHGFPSLAITEQVTR